MLFIKEDTVSYSDRPLPKCSPPNWSEQAREQKESEENSSSTSKKKSAKNKKNTNSTASTSRFKSNGEGYFEPADLADILGPIMKQMRPILEKKTSSFSLEQLQNLWQQVVGPDQAAMSKVVRYRKGVLSIKVAYAPLLAEFRAFAAQGLQQQLVDVGIKNLCELKFSS